MYLNMWDIPCQDNGENNQILQERRGKWLCGALTYRGTGNSEWEGTLLLTGEHMGLITGDNISRCDSIVEGLWRWARAFGGELRCWNTFISCEGCKVMIQSYLGPSSDSGISLGQKSKCKVQCRGKQFQCLQHTDGAKLQAFLEWGSAHHRVLSFTSASSIPSHLAHQLSTRLSALPYLTHIFP